jgi:hypothetical protein
MTAATESHDQGVPLGNGSPDEPAHTLPAEPSHVTQVGKSTNGDAGETDNASLENSATEEPQLALEPDLPTDGRDEVGEAMIRELPQRPELSETPSQPSPSNQSS